MKSIGEKIADGIQKFYTAFINQRVLTTPEEVQANTNEKNLASAVVVGELYNNLAHGQIEFDIDANGKGYYRKTGADTWSPFSSSFTLTLRITVLMTYKNNPNLHPANCNATAIFKCTDGVVTLQSLNSGNIQLGVNSDQCYIHVSSISIVSIVFD